MSTMIVCDIDGTIIKRDDYNDNISEYAQDIYKRVMENNIFVLATGRIFENTMKLINKYNIGHYLIGLNGSFIYDINKKRFIFKKKISKRVCNKICKLAMPNAEKIYLCTFNNWNFYTNIDKYKNNLYSEEKLIKDPFDVISKEDIYKFEIYFSNIEDTNKFISKIKRFNVSNNIIERRFNRGYYVEIMYKNINKYYAVNKLSKKLKVKNNNIITFGDNNNDYEMIKYSGYGIAVGNASDYLKSVAKKVIGNVDEDSVPKYIEENILKKSSIN